jgi:hypothetical protein
MQQLEVASFFDSGIMLMSEQIQFEFASSVGSSNLRNGYQCLINL